MSLLRHEPGWASVESPTSPAVSREPSWPTPCEEQFEYLATHHPLELLCLIASGTLEPSLLTFAAEQAGRVPTSFAPRALHHLVPLLQHPKPYVREGALYGLASLADRIPEVWRFIERHATDAEHSEGVRAAARSLLLQRT